MPNERCESFFRALAELLRRRTEFSFSRNDSDRDSFRFRRQAHEFDPIVERIIERVRGERYSAPALTAEKTPDQPSCSSTRRGLSFTRAKIALRYSW